MTEPSKNRELMRAMIALNQIHGGLEDRMSDAEAGAIINEIERLTIALSDSAREHEQIVSMDNAAMDKMQAMIRQQAEYAEDMAKLLREWRSTELDSMDEDFQPWLDSFTARVVAALAKNQRQGADSPAGQPFASGEPATERTVSQHDASTGNAPELTPSVQSAPATTSKNPAWQTPIVDAQGDVIPGSNHAIEPLTVARAWAKPDEPNLCPTCGMAVEHQGEICLRCADDAIGDSLSS